MSFQFWFDSDIVVDLFYTSSNRDVFKNHPIKTALRVNILAVMLPVYSNKFLLMHLKELC